MTRKSIRSEERSDVVLRVCDLALGRAFADVRPREVFKALNSFKSRTTVGASATILRLHFPGARSTS